MATYYRMQKLPEERDKKKTKKYHAADSFVLWRTQHSKDPSPARTPSPTTLNPKPFGVSGEPGPPLPRLLGGPWGDPGVLLWPLCSQGGELSEWCYPWGANPTRGQTHQHTLCLAGVAHRSPWVPHLAPQVGDFGIMPYLRSPLG